MSKISLLCFAPMLRLRIVPTPLRWLRSLMAIIEGGGHTSLTHLDTSLHNGGMPGAPFKLVRHL